MSSNPTAKVANPVADDAYEDAWRDPEGRAAFERIVATDPSVGRPRRSIRRVVAVGTAVAVAAAAAVVAVAAGTSDNVTQTPRTRPAAWVVTQAANGTVTVEFRDYRDPKGLQARLRAAGVRANVVTLTTACYPASTRSGRFGILFVESSITQSDVAHLFPFSDDQNLSVDPSYLPAGDTIWIGFPPRTTPAADQFFSLAVEPTSNGPGPCPLRLAMSHEGNQSGYLVRPGN